MSNRLNRAVSLIYKAPEFTHSYLLTKLFCSTVKFAGTSKVTLHAVSENQTILSLKNKKRVQNHIGGIHAVAAALLAESATGILLGMNISDKKIPLLKSMQVDYNRRMVGDLKAIANLSGEQISQINSNDKGNTVIHVSITDESGQEPIDCKMSWAWVLKRSN